MSVRAIPQSFVFKCDFCGSEIERDSNNHPTYWAYLRFVQDAYDWSGCPVADGSTESLLCVRCKELAQKAVNEVYEKVSKG